MDLITTGISASERMRRESLVSTARNLIMEKMQIGGSSTRLIEVGKIYVKEWCELLILFQIKRKKLIHSETSFFISYLKS